MPLPELAIKPEEQLQKEILNYLSKEIEPYSGELPVSQCWTIQKRTNNECAGPEFFKALTDLIDKGVVKVIPATTLTGLDHYKLVK